MSLLAVFGFGAVLAALVLTGAGAMMEDESFEDAESADGQSPAPLRVLMAPGGTAVALPQYVTTSDGDVRARWPHGADAGVRQVERAAA